MQPEDDLKEKKGIMGTIAGYAISILNFTSSWIIKPIHSIFSAPQETHDQWVERTSKKPAFQNLVDYFHKPETKANDKSNTQDNDLFEDRPTLTDEQDQIKQRTLFFEKPGSLPEASKLSLGTTIKNSICMIASIDPIAFDALFSAFNSAKDENDWNAKIKEYDSKHNGWVEQNSFAVSRLLHIYKEIQTKNAKTVLNTLETGLTEAQSGQTHLAIYCATLLALACKMGVITEENLQEGTHPYTKLRRHQDAALEMVNNQENAALRRQV